jgi:hypothetical protein
MVVETQNSSPSIPQPHLFVYCVRVSERRQHQHLSHRTNLVMMEFQERMVWEREEIFLKSILEGQPIQKPPKCIVVV